MGYQVERFWHAIYVKSRAEKKVLMQLEDMGITAYLPMITQVKQWSDRRKKVQEPLFRSYVFVYSNEKEYIPILNVFGVVRFVTFEHKAVVVPENQIIAIKKFVEDYEQGEEFKMLNNEDLKEGQEGFGRSLGHHREQAPPDSFHRCGGPIHSRPYFKGQGGACV